MGNWSIVSGYKDTRGTQVKEKTIIYTVITIANIISKKILKYFYKYTNTAWYVRWLI